MTNLKMCRESKGLSQSQLSKKSGISVRSIQHYEQKERNIDNAKLDNILTLSEALECNFLCLLEDQDLVKRIKKSLKHK